MLLMALLGASAAQAADRRRTEVRSTLPRQVLMPAASTPQALSAPILSGLDYSAVAPPGVRLRLIEDEPYTLAFAAPGAKSPQLSESLTRLTLHAETPAIDGIPLGSYEAQISLRLAGRAGPNGALAQAFDAAAHAAYRRSLLRQEQRGAIVYGIDEIRSPLGLTDPKDSRNNWREYLAYSAAAINPNSDEGAARLTPYQYIRGELRVLRLVDKRECLLSISIEAREFPQALTLTENIARCIVNRLVAPKPWQRLEYLAYYPEAERAALSADEVLDPRTADLAEQPGEGCGINPLPIQGDLCPDCAGQGPFWPARPYADAWYIHVLAAQVAQAVCSHCLLGPAQDALLPASRSAPPAAQPKPDASADDEPASCDTRDISSLRR
jgi:hypothetical protein